MDQIVVFGISCAGKSTFAKTLVDHEYISFDALFPWHQIETFGMSITAALDHVAKSCSGRFVLDGWHTADLKGEHLPQCTVCLVYTEYDRVLEQYPRQVLYHQEFIPMYRKWYSYDNPEARYFYNQGDFIETDLQTYRDFITCELERNQ